MTSPWLWLTLGRAAALTWLWITLAEEARYSFWGLWLGALAAPILGALIDALSARIRTATAIAATLLALILIQELFDVTGLFAHATMGLLLWLDVAHASVLARQDARGRIRLIWQDGALLAGIGGIAYLTWFISAEAAVWSPWLWSSLLALACLAYPLTMGGFQTQTANWRDWPTVAGAGLQQFAQSDKDLRDVKQCLNGWFLTVLAGAYVYTVVLTQVETAWVSGLCLLTAAVGALATARLLRVHDPKRITTLGLCMLTLLSLIGVATVSIWEYWVILIALGILSGLSFVAVRALFAVLIQRNQAAQSWGYFTAAGILAGTLGVWAGQTNPYDLTLWPAPCFLLAGFCFQFVRGLGPDKGGPFDGLQNVKTFFGKCQVALARILVEPLFGRIRVEGMDRWPTNRPLILVTNQANPWLDKLLLTAIAPRHLRFVHQEARATSLLSAGTQIVYYEASCPQTQLQLKPLSADVVRLATDQGCDLLPVHLTYDEPKRFRSPVNLVIGQPIQIAQEQGSVDLRAQRERIAADLQALTPSLTEEDLDLAADQIVQLYGEQAPQVLGYQDQPTTHEALKSDLKAYLLLDGQRTRLFIERLEAYQREVARLSTPENHDPIPVRMLLRILAGFFSFTTFGLLTNWPPYSLVRRLTDGRSPSVMGMLTALICFGAYYALIGFIGAFLIGPLLSAIFIAAMLLAAPTCIGGMERYVFRLRRLQILWQAFWTQDTNDDLEATRLFLIQERERFRETYAFHLAEETP